MADSRPPDQPLDDAELARFRVNVRRLQQLDAAWAAELHAGDHRRRSRISAARDIVKRHLPPPARLLATIDRLAGDGGGVPGVCGDDSHRRTRAACPCVGYDGRCHDCPDPDQMPLCRTGRP